jgi:5'-nucleotidase (lipoprotein e(P4) family)
MEMKRKVRTGRITILSSKSILYLLLFAGLISCKQGESVIAAHAAVEHGQADTEVLSLHGVNSALYQHTSAEVHYLFQQCYALAKIKLDRNLLDAFQEPPAVVVDVDETVLDNSRYEMERLALGKTFDPESWAEWVERREATPIPGSLTFLNYAKERNCAIYYITNRTDSEKSATVDNLAKLGYPDADSLHVLTKTETSDKTDRRRQVQQQYDIMLLIGDQLRDYDEIFKERGPDFGKEAVDASIINLERRFVLTPNAVYGTWKSAIEGKGDAGSKMMQINRFLEDYRSDK